MRHYSLSLSIQNLERLLERLTSVDRDAEVDGNWTLLSEMAAIPARPDGKNPIGDQWDQLLRQREMILPLAKEKCDRCVVVVNTNISKEAFLRLRMAVSKCDYFEQALCNCQSWTNHVR